MKTPAKAPAKPRAPRGKAKGGRVTDSAPLADLSEIEFARAMLRDALLDLDEARASGSMTALSQARAAAIRLRRELREIEGDLEGPRTGRPRGTDEELLDALCTAILGISDAHFERVLETVELRRTGRPALRVVDR